MGQKVSLVLSGGGARGIAHIGVIEELEKQGFEIFSISGTSMGALVGGVYGLGKMTEFKDWIITLDKRKVFRLADFTLSKQGLIKGDRVLNAMKKFIPDANIEDLETAYCAVAADIINQEEVAFTSGSVFEAIRASIAIPTVFTPVKTSDRLLVDGGVLNNIPINHAKRIPNDILIVVNVNANIAVDRPAISKKASKIQESNYRRKIRKFYSQLMKSDTKKRATNIGYFDLITKTISLMTYQMEQMILEQNSPDILINVSRDSCEVYDFFKAEELVEIGRRAAIKGLAEYRDKKTL